MKKGFNHNISVDDHLGCFGNFKLEDPICKKFCVLSLRCALERDRNARQEFLEDIVFSDGMPIILQ